MRQTGCLIGAVEQAAAVLADPRWVAGAEALFVAARRAKVPTVLDADMADPDVFTALLPLADHAIFSEPALRRFAGDDLEAGLVVAAGKGCRVAAVTRGQHGVNWREDGISQHAPAFAVDVVDTTGAGNVFHGSYAIALGACLESAAAIRFAAAAAALKCTRPGGRAGIPTLDDTLALLRTLP